MEFRITQIAEVQHSNQSGYLADFGINTRLHVEFKAYQHIGMDPYTLTAVLPSTGKFADLKIGQVWSFTAPEDVATETNTGGLEDPRFKMWQRAETKLHDVELRGDEQANCTDSSIQNWGDNKIEAPENWLDNKSWNPLRHTARENEAHEADEQTQRLLATLDDDDDPTKTSYWERHW
jgi:hypothetical protein